MINQLLNTENEIKDTVIALTAHANEVIEGSYKNVDNIFKLTDPTKNSPEVVNLAEAFGMMLVNVEAREYALELKMQELKEKNNTTENLLVIRHQLSTIFIGVVSLITIYIFILGYLEIPSVASLPNISSIRQYASRFSELLTLGIVVFILLILTSPLYSIF